ncbi:MAG: response regulator [Anaerolineales bacterium]|nr:response regulator [Anaerolineales bacterium]
MTSNNPRILVVDDEPVSLMLLDTILRRSSFAVATALSGHEALTLLQQEPFDLMILDLLMPDMDGLTVLEILRKDPYFENFPVIVFTAVSQNRVRLDAFEKGATTFLTKPVSSHELTRVVNKYLQASTFSADPSHTG